MRGIWLFNKNKVLDGPHGCWCCGWGIACNGGGDSQPRKRERETMTKNGENMTWTLNYGTSVGHLDCIIKVGEAFIQRKFKRCACFNGFHSFQYTRITFYIFIKVG